MIKNNRPMAINISFKGKQVGFSAGECKKLAHFFTPMDEYILAKRFGLQYIPDVENEAVKTNTQVKKQEEEKHLETISKEILNEKAESQEMLQKQIDNLKVIAKQELEKKQKENLHSESIVEMKQAQFMENDTQPVKDHLKQKAEIVEGPVKIVENDEEILLTKPVVENKTSTKKKATTKKKTTTKKK